MHLWRYSTYSGFLHIPFPGLSEILVVDSKGCEIVSVIRKSDNKQYIWSGQPDIWKRHTPVLFPLVGRYKNDTSNPYSQLPI